MEYSHALERPSWSGAAATTHVILRFGVALLFMQHGAQKLLGWFGGMNGEGATAALATQMGVAGMLELGGGFLLFIGLLTRPVALLLVLEMFAAYLIAHAPQAVVPIQNQGELALLYAFAFLFFFGNGAGRLSVDNWWATRHRHTAAPGPHVRVERTAPTAEPLPQKRGHAA